MGIGRGSYKGTNAYARCEHPKEAFCTKIRFEDTDPQRPQVK